MVATSVSAPVAFPSVSFRRIASPLDSLGQRSYVAVVNVFDIPDLSAWRKINVRDAKLTGAVPRGIRETLDSNPGMFLFKNRGLVITCGKVSHDNETGTVQLGLSDENLHGLLDGGHTYEVIKEYIKQTERSELSLDRQAYVRLELMEGLKAEEIRDVVEARNTSNQVKDQSLLNLQGKFDDIKQAIEHQPYATQVAYSEYEILEGSDGSKPKPIDIRDIVAILTAFDRDHFTENAHPIVAYSSKANCLNRFESHVDSYRKIYPLTPDLLKLWDTIHQDLPDWYRIARMNQGQGSRFGRITGVSTLKGKATPLYFLGSDSSYAIPTAFKYPILAAMRAFLEECNGQYVWGKGLNPFEVLANGLGEQLADALLSYALDLQNPNKLGKTSIVWDQCYSKAQIWYLKA